ncbi:MAG: FAD-dependent oxidoreductase [Bacillaceae bacterium]|nr:FAD-dependent oxidoreductase [Bacillaceae bacterium]
MPAFSSLKRDEIISDMQEEPFDLLIIGGGITGAGIALDAASRGIKTALVDMQDFAAGTSSRSTKLVHGGLRYLKQLEVKLIAEVGREREIVYENGPHVTTPEWMMLPFYEGGTFGPFTTNVGLRVYDLLAGVKREERRKMLSPEEALKKEPLLKPEGLKGAGYYVEYKTDDARLTLEVLKKAAEFGACALNYAKLTQFLYNDGRAEGAVIEDQITGQCFHVYARKIVNAAGPWVDTIRLKDQSRRGKHLHITKGVHLVFDQNRFPLKQAVYFDTPDGRMVFAIPREGKTYVGTTDTSYTGNLAAPRATEEDRYYLLQAIDSIFPELKIQADDVESTWAGLRPLIYEEGKNPSEISRKDELFTSDSGLMSIAGGKLTGYRKMAEEVVDLVARELQKEMGQTFPKSRTRYLPISGGEAGGSQGFERYKQRKIKEGLRAGLDEKTSRELVERYGTNVDLIFQYVQEDGGNENQWKLDLAVYAMLCYAVEHEMAYTPADFFIRRTGALYFHIDWVQEHKEKVAAYLAHRHGWTEEQREGYSAELNQFVKEARMDVASEM